MPIITMEEIARKAGVTRQTVSYIINNRPISIKKETREKVLDLVKKMDYRPNYLARSLKTGKTNCIGLMGSLTFMNLNFPYFSDIAAGLEDELVACNSQYTLNMFGANHNQTYDKTVELIKKGIVDGLILVVVSPDLESFQQDLKPVLDNCRMPFVVIHSTSRKLPYNNVGLDSFYGGYLAGEHLVKQGYRDIRLYCIDEYSPQGREVNDGFKKALAEHGIAWRQDMEIGHVSSPRGDSYRDAFKTFLDLKTVPRSLFVPDDRASIGVLHAARERGITVPHDLALVGFNDARPIVYFEDELTAVRHPVREKAAAALSILLDLLSGARRSDQVHAEIIKPWLDVKKSTAK